MDVLFLLLVLFFYFFPTMCQFPVSYVAIQGEWHLLHESIGISAMHMQLLHNNKVVIFDRTDFGHSNISLPDGHCRYDPDDIVLKHDCTAHSILYDINSNTFRPLMVQTDTWCSSGTVLPDGTLVQTGGYNDGDRVVRILASCIRDTCDWVEFPGILLQRRWYATDQILPDGQIIIVGGRGQFNYEFYPKRSSSSSSLFTLEFLKETKDENENNLYPFLHLLPDGNLFIFANIRSIVFDYKQNKVVREFPSITNGDSRNYPSSGSSVLLPLDENGDQLEVEVMICGGAPYDAFQNAKKGIFTSASSTCGRLKITDDPNPIWRMEKMPMSRVMSDMLLLPNGDVVIINGAASGTAGWEFARNPVTRPLIYKPRGVPSNRFSIMETSQRPRLYHSTAILLIDGRVLVGGSNPHVFYNFTGVEYPTDLSLEAFSPPYLAALYEPVRPTIVRPDDGNARMYYQQPFTLTFTIARFLQMGDLSVCVIAPSFTTHAFSMNQRMVVLKVVDISIVAPGTYRVIMIGPSSVEIAPPGYYMLFVVHAGIPSSGMWVKINV